MVKKKNESEPGVEPETLRYRQVAIRSAPHNLCLNAAFSKQGVLNNNYSS